MNHTFDRSILESLQECLESLAAQGLQSPLDFSILRASDVCCLIVDLLQAFVSPRRAGQGQGLLNFSHALQSEPHRIEDRRWPRCEVKTVVADQRPLGPGPSAFLASGSALCTSEACDPQVLCVQLAPLAALAPGKLGTGRDLSLAIFQT